MPSTMTPFAMALSERAALVVKPAPVGTAAPLEPLPTEGLVAEAEAVDITEVPLGEGSVAMLRTSELNRRINKSFIQSLT